MYCKCMNGIDNRDNCGKVIRSLENHVIIFQRSIFYFFIIYLLISDTNVAGSTNIYPKKYPLRSQSHLTNLQSNSNRLLNNNNSGGGPSSIAAGGSSTALFENTSSSHSSHRRHPSKKAKVGAETLGLYLFIYLAVMLNGFIVRLPRRVCRGTACYV